MAITLLYSNIHPQDSVPCIHPQAITCLRIPFEFFCSVCVISRETELFLQTKYLQLILQGGSINCSYVKQNLNAFHFTRVEAALSCVIWVCVSNRRAFLFKYPLIKWMYSADGQWTDRDDIPRKNIEVCMCIRFSRAAL